ncbi:MAG: MucR family transcriptional regulator [Pseudomonadota bacterium]
MNNDTHNEDLLAFTTEIVSSYLDDNKIAVSEIPALIQQVYGALAGLQSGEGATQLSRPEPAIAISKSVRPDYLICLEDGKKLKMLKRHLMTAYNLTPEQYRARWNLPSDYPMVAANYAKQRSDLARTIGLGVKGREKRAANAKKASA